MRKILPLGIIAGAAVFLSGNANADIYPTADSNIYSSLCITEPAINTDSILAANTKYALQDPNTGMVVESYSLSSPWKASIQVNSPQNDAPTWKTSLSKGNARGMRVSIVKNAGRYSAQQFAQNIANSFGKQIGSWYGLGNITIASCNLVNDTSPEAQQARMMLAQNTGTVPQIFDCNVYYTFQVKGQAYKGRSHFSMFISDVGRGNRSAGCLNNTLFAAPTTNFASDYQQFNKIISSRQENPQWTQYVNSINASVAQRNQQIRTQINQMNNQIINSGNSYPGNYGGTTDNSNFENTMDRVRRMRSEQIRDKSSWVDSDGVRHEYNNF